MQVGACVARDKVEALLLDLSERPDDLDASSEQLLYGLFTLSLAPPSHLSAPAADDAEMSGQRLNEAHANRRRLGKSGQDLHDPSGVGPDSSNVEATAWEGEKARNGQKERTVLSGEAGN